jgi:cell division protein ZapA (FtsZ GTPase activity inhibitor)
MDAPNELSRTPLPEDLRLLLRELKVPENDPILPLLGWLWTQINQTTNTIADARMALIAALDTRLEKMTTSAELLGGVGQQMEQTRSAMDAIRTEIGQRIGAELKSPIDSSITSCRSLATLLDRLLNQTTEVLAHARRRQIIATLAAGFVTGILTGLCLSSLGCLHR